MPATALKHFAKRAKVPLKRVEHLWDRAGELVSTEYDVTKDDSSYWALRMGITKRMLGISEKIRFSDFLMMQEEAVGLKPQYDPVDVNKAAAFIEQHCKDSIKWIKAGLGFWRADKHAQMETHGFAFVNAADTERKSQNTSNHYTVLMDSNPYMQEFPKRSRSFIATTDPHYAERFKSLNGQEKFMIIPMDGQNVGVVPAFDMWEMDPTPIFGSDEVISDLNFDFDTLGITDTVQSFKSFDAQLRANPGGKAEKEVKERWPTISDKQLANFLDSIYRAFANAGFEKYTTKTIPEAVLRDEREVWVGGKCLLVAESMVQQLAEQFTTDKS